jgi:cellulose synthase/poly-beta-1,6-N-acetylglucosamine synthase-like glycosyltransferase
MSVTPLRLRSADNRSARESPALATPASQSDLLRGGQLSGHALLAALRRGASGEQATMAALAQQSLARPHQRDTARPPNGLGLLTRSHGAPDPALLDQFGATACLTDGLMPWRRVGDVTVVAATSSETFIQNRPRLTALFGPVVPTLCAEPDLRRSILRMRGAALVRAAETTLAAEHSCRSYDPARMARWFAGAAFAILPVLVLRPVWVLAAFTLLAMMAMVGFTGLRMAAWFALRNPEPPLPEVSIARLPVISIIVALYGENNIAPRLIRRLKSLTYSKDLLDVVLAVEEDDHPTRAALTRSDLPLWMRVVVVPAGSIRTKPRALNYALDYCRGSFVGIYDAEDAPEADQIDRMVRHFHARGADVVCLQGVLDYYNPRQNWLSRCFTIEYAAWFRLLLPGIARLGLVVPLGGTSLFFRRAALEQLGRWDAHNVTEDCDLGIRIARHGWRTEIVKTTTYEEANCRARPWVKQRSRWIKGFMITWLTHMKDPVRLWQDLGPKRFFGVQLLVFGSFTHALLVPLLWSFWIGVFGYSHPLAGAMGPLLVTVLAAIFALSGLLGMAFGLGGLMLSRQAINPLWLLTMALYNSLATLAAWKAAYEMFCRPFWWDKTRHGLSAPSHTDP